MKQIVRIAEGTGDNLLPEDQDQGYVDYIYYEQYELSQDMPEVDGGQVMLERWCETSTGAWRTASRTY